MAETGARLVLNEEALELITGSRRHQRECDSTANQMTMNSTHPKHTQIHEQRLELWATQRQSRTTSWKFLENYMIMKQRDPTVILTNSGQLCSPSKGALCDAKTITLVFIMHETMKSQVMLIFLTHGVFITACCTDANNMIQGIVKKQKQRQKQKIQLWIPVPTCMRRNLAPWH